MIPNPKGAKAEQYAAQFLTSHGLTLLHQNWHCRYGELDLIMQEGDYLVFVEVKARTSTQFGGAIASLTPNKCKKLWQSAELFLAEYYGNLPPPCRFDAVCLQGKLPPIWLKDILSANEQ